MMLLHGLCAAADQRGVDIIQNCEVTDFVIKMEYALVSGPSWQNKRWKNWRCGCRINEPVMAKAGLRLPIESHVLQAFVSEGLKPAIPV